MRVGITGHRGLPDASAELVRAAIGEVLSRFSADDLVGVSCIADGPDAWFAQAVLERGGGLEVVVPAEEYRESLPVWHHAVYDSLMNAASEVHMTGLTESDSEAHMSGSEILVRVSDEVVAVWDGRPARGYGGTADVVACARRNGVPVRVVWPGGATRD